MSEKAESEWAVSWKQIGIVILTFSLGLICALLFSNAQEDIQTSFSTTELIAFTLSIVLSGASIVLAISAIALGKLSEQSVIQRSDESIRLQNEVFVKTTEALQRIEASTGVTEKRIEDMISGRVGDISHQVAQMATRGTKGQIGNVKELEESVRTSLLRSLRAESSKEAKEDYEQKMQEAEAQEEKYQANHEKLLLAVGNSEGIKIEKLGHGGPEKDGEGLFDGIFSKAGKRLAVSTLRPDVDPDAVDFFVPAFSKELSIGTVNSAVLVFFDADENSNIVKKTKEQLSFLKSEISEKIKLFWGSYEEIEGIKASIVEKL